MKGNAAGPAIGFAAVDAHAVAARAGQQPFGRNLDFGPENPSMHTDSRVLSNDCELSREPAIG